MCRNTFVRADDFIRMSARKLIYRAMVCAPAMFLIGIGVHARGMTDEFDFVANDARTEKALLAYVPYIKQSQRFTRDRSVGEARRLAGLWIKGAEEGDLKPLPPIAYDDTSSDGPKSQAFSTRAKITSRLMTETFQDVQDGNLHQAVIDGTLAIRIAEVQKYSDFISLFNCVTEQRRTIEAWQLASGKMTAKDRKLVAQALVLCRGNYRVIENMANRSRQIFLEWRKQRGYEPLSIEDTKLLSEMPAFVSGNTASSMRDLPSRNFASTDDHLPMYYSSLQLAVNAQALLDERGNELMRKLAHKEAPH
jgi:hypothetical protein